MSVTIEIESMCCCWRPAAVAGCGSSDPMVAQGEQPLGPPWRTHREGRGGCQGSLRVGDGVKESKGGRVLEAWKNLDVVRSALSVVRLRAPPGMAIRGGRARDRGWRDRSETVEAAVVGRTVQGLQCCAVEKKEPGQDRNELRRVTPSPWPHVPVPHFISVMGVVSGSPVLMAGEDGFEMPTWNISITDWPEVWFGLSCDERVHVSNSNPDLVPSCVPPTRPSFSSLGEKDDGSPSDPVDRGEKHWPFLFLKSDFMLMPIGQSRHRPSGTHKGLVRSRSSAGPVRETTREWLRFWECECNLPLALWSRHQEVTVCQAGSKQRLPFRVVFQMEIPTRSSVWSRETE